METRDYGGQMQEEMIQEIEKANPKFLVVVHIQTSWLVRNDSVKTIFNWAETYSRTYYDVVGMMVLMSDGQPLCQWCKHHDCMPNNNYLVAVYERKQ